MDLGTQNHLAELRGLLNFRLQQLRTEVRAMQLARHDADQSGPRDVEDRKEEASRLQLDGLDEVQETRDLKELAEVEAALMRLDAGRYGDCLDCELPIPLKRLRVQPAALRCAECQVRHERSSSHQK